MPKRLQFRCDIRDLDIVPAHHHRRRRFVLLHLAGAGYATVESMATKTDIYGGKSPRELPLYTVAEAARVVRVHPATLRTWVLGRSYPTRSGHKAWSPLIRVADRKQGRLSFVNLVEVHVLSALRGKQVRVERIRSATKFIQGAMPTAHPLADVDMQTDCIDIYVEYLGQLVNVELANHPASSGRALPPAHRARRERSGESPVPNHPR